MSEKNKLTQPQAIRWILHHGKLQGRFAYTLDGSQWFIGEASDAEKATGSGHFWELKDRHMRMWERCLDAKTLRREWIVREWCDAAATAHALESLGKRCSKCAT